MKAKFRNNDGSLTAYALGCGYIQTETVPGGRFEVRLSADGCYHVQVRDEELSLGLAAWESYDTLTEARKAVRAAVRFYRGQNDAKPAERDNTGGPAPWEA